MAVQYGDNRQKEVEVMKAAFVSYNAIPGYSAGWHENNGHRALVLPNTMGKEHATDSPGKRGAKAVVNEIDRLWTQLRDVLSEIDHVVIYVGAQGSEYAIELASRIDSSKVTYVLCDCLLERKQKLLVGVGHAEARQIMCECSGTETMSRLCGEFLESGLIGQK